MLLSCGEALIDLIINENKQITAHEGGSPFNTARVCAQLGLATRFFSAISTDYYGECLVKTLRASGVDTSQLVRSPLASTLAIVNKSMGAASYSFYTAASSCYAYTQADFAALDLSPIEFIQFGSFSTALEPYRSLFFKFLTRAAPRRITSFDINIRPLLIPNPELYKAELPQWLALSDILKISDEDLRWLYPDSKRSLCIEQFQEQGVKLILYTQGAAGATLYSQRSSVHVPIYRMPFIDAIAAGDTFHGAALAYLAHKGSGAKIAKFSEVELRELGEFASKAAAFNCAKPGASPPSLASLEEL